MNNNLTEIANNINLKFAQSKELHQIGVATIKEALLLDKECGELLIKVKESLAHGEFMPWIEANCKFTHRHANRLINVAKNWQRIKDLWEDKFDTRVEFEETPILSLRGAIALIAAEPKPTPTPKPPPESYTVNNPQHSCHGQTVKFSQSLHNGDLVMCETPGGQKVPFLKTELVSPDSLPPQQEPEIIDVEIEDNSEKLREAIALILEYLPELSLKALLAQALFAGREYLPEDTQNMAAKLISQEMAALNGSSFA